MSCLQGAINNLKCVISFTEDETTVEELEEMVLKLEAIKPY